MKRIDPFPLIQLALIALVVVVAVGGLLGWDAVAVLGAIYGATWLLTVVSDEGARRGWW